jgi:preprotein translocase subunit Sec63
MKFFNDCKNLDDIKSEYRKLVKQYHPDSNPGMDDEMIKIINNEYDLISAKMANLTDDQNGNFEAAIQFKEKINEIVNLSGIIIEIVGCWIWVTGMTKEVKTELREAGFWWASKKFAWYWHPVGFGGGRGKSSLDEIRTKYGSTVVNKSFQKAIA